MTWSSQWISLVSALGVGGVTAALLSRWSLISNLRQKWIDALRDDLAEYFRQIDASYQNARPIGMPGATSEDVDLLQASRNHAMLFYRRILLRLNMNESLHRKLNESLKRLQIVTSATPSSELIDKAVSLSQQVLKQEWNRAKYGSATRFVVSFKTALAALRTDVDSSEEPAE